MLKTRPKSPTAHTLLLNMVINMKREYIEPLCEQISLLTENALLTGSLQMRLFLLEDYGTSTDDTENWS